MRKYLSLLHSEWLKIKTVKAFRVSMILMLLLAPAISWLEGRQYLSIGLDATPATNPSLIEPIDPVEYLGLNAASISIMVLVILGGILGALEFQHHGLRTSLLSCNHRLKLLTSKLLTFSLMSALSGFCSIYLSYIIMHLALGKEGLHPIFLSPAAWDHILWKSLALTLLGLLSYLLGLGARIMLVPLIFLVPQIYNLGNYLAAHTAWGQYLPQPATELFASTPYSSYSENPSLGLLILGMWLLAVGAVACWRFLKTDVGGRY